MIKSFQKLLEDIIFFYFHALLMRFQCLPRSWGNMFWQFSIRDFAEYLLVASRSYQIQKSQKWQNLFGIIDFSDLEKPRKTIFQI